MKINLLSLSILASALLAATCPAAVLLTPSTSSFMVSPGDTFEFDLNIQITAGEEVTGVDYYWEISAPGSGFLSITGRDFAGGVFPFINLSNAVVLASPGNILDPVNDSNLGGGVAEITEPVSTGTWLVAHYTFTVDLGAAPGTYTLSTGADTGDFYGWVGPSPDFDNFEFDASASVSIEIIPEPGVPLLLAGAFLFFAARGARRKARNPRGIVLLL